MEALQAEIINSGLTNLRLDHTTPSVDCLKVKRSSTTSNYYGIKFHGTPLNYLDFCP